jgi:hypothetical protein
MTVQELVTAVNALVVKISKENPPADAGIRHVRKSDGCEDLTAWRTFYNSHLEKYKGLELRQALSFDRNRNAGDILFTPQEVTLTPGGTKFYQELEAEWVACELRPATTHPENGEPENHIHIQTASDPLSAEVQSMTGRVYVYYEHAFQWPTQSRDSVDACMLYYRQVSRAQCSPTCAPVWWDWSSLISRLMETDEVPTYLRNNKDSYWFVPKSTEEVLQYSRKLSRDLHNRDSRLEALIIEGLVEMAFYENNKESVSAIEECHPVLKDAGEYSLPITMQELMERTGASETKLRRFIKEHASDKKPLIKQVGRGRFEHMNNAMSRIKGLL